MKAHYHGPQGQLQLFFGNKADGQLERLICNVPPSAQFQMQLAGMPTSIEAKRQTQVRLHALHLEQLPYEQPGYRHLEQ